MYTIYLIHRENRKKSSVGRITQISSTPPNSIIMCWCKNVIYIYTHNESQIDEAQQSNAPTLLHLADIGSSTFAFSRANN